MTGKALICRLKNIQEIPGADKIVQANLFGETVIISKDHKEQELGLLFDCETQLSPKFCHNNNLYRHSDLNKDKSKTGYIEDNRRVRPIRLRGVRCSGLWLPIDSLQFTGFSVDRIGKDKQYISEGFELEQLNEVAICNKYITQKTRQGRENKQGKARVNLCPTFKEHIDTDQLMRNLHNIHEGDLVTITEKLHGTCMLSKQRVLMGDFSYKKISKIKVGEYVMGFDHNLGYTVPSRVLKVWDHGKNEDFWHFIKFSRNGLLGNYYGSIYCTKEHELFVNGKYIEAKEVKEGDMLKIIRTDYEIEDFQKQVLIGKFLGDGSIKIRDHGLAGKMTFGHFIKQLDYIDYCNQILGDLSYIEEKEYISGYGSKMKRCHTKDIAFIQQYFSQYIIDGKRKLNDSMIQDINPISLAFLYMDDGSLSNLNGQNYRADLALCNFDLESCNVIKRALLKFGINSVIHNSGGYHRIRMNFKDASIFYNLISPYIPKSMQYKIPEQLRGYNPIVPKTINKFTSYIFESNVIESCDTGKKSINGMSKMYDITTETGNFFAGEILVHNSGRCGNLPILRQKNVFERVLNKIGLNTPDSKYKFIVGSRKVVKSIGDTQYTGPGFYESDLWTKAAKQNFEGKLRKGESIYFEIVGYTPEGSPIMGSHSNEKLKKFMDKDEYRQFIERYGDQTVFSYGCTSLALQNQPQYDIYVYRITMTNEDGESIDYSWNQVKTRCEQLGVKHVPELSRFIPYVGFGVNEGITGKSISQQLEEGIQKITDQDSDTFKQHLKEGIVVRIDNGGSIPLFYKSKGYLFKVLEGIIKDTDVVDLEEVQS